MNIYKLGNINDKKMLLKELGVELGGISIISKKMDLLYFYISDLKTPAINILKQDALSIGAELAVPSGVITCEQDSFDCILIGSIKQIEILSKKELSQPFGLKELAGKLAELLVQKKQNIRIMGIINANSDSFYKNSRFLGNDAVNQIEQMITDGADIIDIGAVSSRPGSTSVSQRLEMDRIRPICDAIRSKKLYEKALFSIDSYTHSTVEYALNCGFSIINDITGATDDRIIKLAIKYNTKLCIMHMKGIPKTMQLDPYYDNVVIEVDNFFGSRIQKCKELGLDKKNIILDIGIGFGKKLIHNIELLRNLSHFRHFGCDLLVGASRKSMIDQIVSSNIEERLPGTLALHLKAIQNGADVIRCHDIAEHSQALKIWQHIN